MRHIILTLLCCLILIVPIECAAQPPCASNLPIYYYWINPGELILWKALDDHPLTVRRDGQQWQIDQAETPTWRPIFEQIAAAYKLPAPGTVNDSTLVWYVVAKIHNEPSGKIARPRDPDVTIYLEPSDHQAKVDFIDGATRKSSGSASFIETNHTWAKTDRVSLPLIFNVADQPSELAKIFSLTSVDAVPENSKWKTAWQEWIVGFLNQNPAARNFYYIDKDNKTCWVWLERLGQGQKSSGGPRLSVSGPRIDEPGITTIRQPRTENTRWGFGWGFGAGALLIILIVVAYIAYASRSAAKPPKPVEVQPTPSVDADTSTSTAVDTTTLVALHKAALERWQKRVKEVPAPIREMLNSAFEWVGNEYAEAAKAHNLLIDAEAHHEKILSDYRQKNLGLSEDSDDTVLRQWLHIGQLTEKAIGEVRSDLPDEVESKSNRASSMKSWADEVWATKWPQLLSSLNSLLKQAKQDGELLQRQLSDVEDRHRQELKSKEDVARTEWQHKLASSEKQFGTASKQLLEHESRLRIVNEKVGRLESELLTVRAELAGAVSERDQAAKLRDELDNKIAELTKIKYLSRNVRIWLQSCTAIPHRVDSNALAPLAALLNFSLLQMCIGVLDGTADLKRALARNVFVVYQKFVEGAGAHGLSSVLERLNEVAPGVENFEPNERGGVSLDDDLMRSFVYELKRETGQNVSPFYTDIDTNKKILVFVSTS